MKNLLPALSDQQYAALKFDIEKRGVMVAVEIDADTGKTVDGSHRQRAADELGVDYPKIERHFASDADRVDHALKLNLLRRQMDDEAWADAFEQLADVRGARLGSGKGDPSGKAATTSALASELGLSDRQARRKRQKAKKIREIRTKDPDLAEKVKAGEVDLRRAERIMRESDAADRAESAAEDPLPATLDLRVGDFRTALDDLAGSVHAVICDPPYESKHHDLYGPLVETAARLLRPDGTLVILCGTRPEAWLRRLPEMETHLALRWVGCYLTPGAAYRVHDLGIATNWKPVLIFGGRRNLNTDVFRSTGDDKQHHEWGQNEQAFAQIVSAFSDTGDLVVDPFLGGGTTAIVAHGLGRRFVGCDVDPSAIGRTKARLA